MPTPPKKKQQKGKKSFNRKFDRNYSFQPRKTTYNVVFKGEYGTKDEKESTAENLMHKHFHITWLMNLLKPADIMNYQDEDHMHEDNKQEEDVLIEQSLER
eukprot:2180826-Ditylum_brightwellii.AAC.1